MNDDCLHTKVCGLVLVEVTLMDSCIVDMISYHDGGGFHICGGIGVTNCKFRGSLWVLQKHFCGK